MFEFDDIRLDGICLDGVRVDRIRTRRLGTEHLQALLERCADFFIEVYGAPPGPREAERLLADAPPGKVAEDKYVIGLIAGTGKCVGALELVPGYPADSDWWIGLLLLEPALRGRGVGRAVVEAAARGIVAQGGNAIWLCVQEQNERANAFWHRTGFEVMRREHQRLGNRENVVAVMRRALNGTKTGS